MSKIHRPTPSSAKLIVSDSESCSDVDDDSSGDENLFTHTALSTRNQNSVRGNKTTTANRKEEEEKEEEEVEHSDSDTPTQPIKRLKASPTTDKNVSTSAEDESVARYKWLSAQLASKPITARGNRKEARQAEFKLVSVSDNFKKAKWEYDGVRYSNPKAALKAVYDKCNVLYDDKKLKAWNEVELFVKPSADSATRKWINANQVIPPSVRSTKRTRTQKDGSPPPTKAIKKEQSPKTAPHRSPDKKAARASSPNPKPKSSSLSLTSTSSLPSLSSSPSPSPLKCASRDQLHEVHITAQSSIPPTQSITQSNVADRYATITKITSMTDLEFGNLFQFVQDMEVTPLQTTVPPQLHTGKHANSQRIKITSPNVADPRPLTDAELDNVWPERNTTVSSDTSSVQILDDLTQFVQSDISK